MSFWSDVYAGDASRIGEAIVAGEPFAAESFVHAHVKLPGIVPGEESASSPDMLTELAASLTGVTSVTFSGSIAEHLAGQSDPMEATDGAYRMAADWVQLFAQLTNEQIGALATSWCKEWDPGSGQDQVDELATMLKELCRVCQTAKQRGSAVVYSWTM